MYLHEIRQELEEMLFVNVSLSTIFRFLRENKFTRQRLRNIALQRDAFARELYVSEVSVYSSDMFIFVNETGADQRNTLRKHGYSVRRNASSNHSLCIRGERVSAIACMSTKILKGTSNGDMFYDFVQSYLLPHMMLFNGIDPHTMCLTTVPFIISQK